MNCMSCVCGVRKLFLDNTRRAERAPERDVSHAVSATSVVPPSTSTPELWHTFSLIAEHELEAVDEKCTEVLSVSDHPGEGVREEEVDIPPFEAWLIEKVGHDAVHMTDSIADALLAPIPGASIIPVPRGNSVNELFDHEWHKLVSKFDENSGAANGTSHAEPQNPRVDLARREKWDAIRSFVVSWRDEIESNSVLHRYIWTVALQRVSKMDARWAFSRVFRRCDLASAVTMDDSHMLKLIESVRTWRDASSLGLHVILSLPMLTKLLQRLAATRLQNISTYRDTDSAIMWFCLCGRTWRQIATLVKTRAFADYPYYDKLFRNDLTATAESLQVLEKNMYRFLQLGRVHFVVGVLVLVGRYEDAENLVVQRESDSALRTVLRRVRLELSTEDAIAQEFDAGDTDIGVRSSGRPSEERICRGC